MSKIIRISENDIINKGLDYIKTLGVFEVHGNHYQLLRGVEIVLLDLNNYTSETKYYGSGDRGTAITTFTKKIEKGKFIVTGTSVEVNYQVNENYSYLDCVLTIELKSSGNMSFIMNNSTSSVPECVLNHIRNSLPTEF